MVPKSRSTPYVIPTASTAWAYLEDPTCTVGSQTKVEEHMTCPMSRTGAVLMSDGVSFRPDALVASERKRRLARSGEPKV